MIGAVLAVRTSSLEPATGQHHSWLFTGAPSAQVALRCSWLLPQGSARANRLHCPSRCRLLPLSLASQLAAKLHPTATAISNIRLYQLNARSAPSCTPTSTPAVPQLSKPDVQQSIAAGCLSTTPMMSTLLGSFIQHAFWGYAQVGSFRLHSSNAATLPTYHSQYVVHALSSLWGGGGARQVPPTLWPCNRWTSGPALPSFSQPNPWRCFHPAVSAVTSASQHCHNMVYSAVTLASQCCHSSHTPPSGCSQRLQSAIQRRYHSQPALPHHQRHSTSAQLQHDCCQTAWQQHCGAAVAGRMPVDMTLHAVCACCRIAYSAFCGISVS